MDYEKIVNDFVFISFLRRNIKRLTFNISMRKIKTNEKKVAAICIVKHIKHRIKVYSRIVS